MSPTTDTLRRRIDAELDVLEPMPDLTSAAVRAGRTRLRRRRLASGSLLGVAAVGGGLVAGVALTDSEPEPKTPTALDPSGPTQGPVDHDPLADGRVTTHERDEAVRAGLEAVLPERYGAVSVLAKERNRIQMFGTAGGQPPIQIAVATNGRQRASVTGPDETEWSCASQSQARPILSCAEASLGNGWFAVAVNERADATEEAGSTPTYGSTLLVLNDGVWSELAVSELGWDGYVENDPAGITAQELLEMAQDPAYLEMLEVDAAWQPDRDLPHMVVEVPDPVWPS